MFIQRMTVSTVVLAWLAHAPLNPMAAAVETSSGLAVGDAVGAFQVVKAGGIDDGVPPGEQLCYR